MTGPIPATAAPGDPSRDYPWMSTMHNLAAVGHVEEEFFFSGTASRYNTPGPLGTTGSVRDSGHPYTSRMIVRRPIHADRFNGVVIVEWQNVTAGYDLDAHRGGSFDHVLRSGYAWVGVSAQRVGVQGVPNGLRDWSPGRYGDLDVTAGGTITDDALSYEIFARAAQAIRNPGPVAGSSHSGRRTAMNSRPLVIRDGVTPAAVNCAFPPHPRVLNHHATNAAYDQMVLWVDEGIPPPPAPRVTTVGPTIQRDSFGNALGGLRLAEFAVPTAVQTGANSGSAFCSLYGRYLPFDLRP